MAEREASPGIPSAPLHWRVRVCRWLWRALGLVWGTLIVGIGIATVANLNTTTTDTPLTKLYLIHLAQTYPLAVGSGLGLLSALTLLSWLGSGNKQVLSTRPLSEQDRIHMLRRLRLRYEQVIAQSLQGVVQLELGLASRSAAVQNAVRLSLRLPDQPEQSLPLHTSIVQAYELAQQELLILGEPGAGKSTLLLELALHLVEQAEQNAIYPLPILLPLSSWAERKRPLDKWLNEETARLYDVPSYLSEQWIEAQQVLPLLDGLDEMEEGARPDCIAAINTYHREHLRPLVVCSRNSEYEAATKDERLALHTAVVVQPLEPKQVDAYLMGLGKPMAGLRAALKTNAILQELVTTPLLLQVLMLTYHGTSVRELFQKEAQLREQIWTDYVEHTVECKGDARRYPLPVTIGWLSRLAYEMRQHNQTIFSLPSRESLHFFNAPYETLDSNWLPARLYNLHRQSSRLLFELVGTLLFGLVGTLAGALLFGLVGMLAGVLVGALLFRLVRALSNALGGELTGVLLSALVGALVGALLGRLLFGLVSALLGALLGVLLGVLLGTLLGALVEILQDAAELYSLRFWLARSGVFPWRAAHFLEDATTRILLRRVGGGYSFAHRLLLDYFADLDTQIPLAQGAAQTKSTSV